MRKKPKVKPSRDLLSFMIYDVGFYEALDLYDLNEEQCELILYGKAEKPVAKAGQWTDRKCCEKAPALSLHLKHLKRVIAQNYEQLFNEAGAYMSKKINSQSLTKYDMFLESVQQLLWSNRDFYFISEQQAISYVRVRLKRSLKKAQVNLHRHNQTVKFTLVYVDPYAMPDFELNSDIEILSLREREVAHLKSEGYSQEEIAYMLDCTQQTISNRLKTIYQKLKTA